MLPTTMRFISVPTPGGPDAMQIARGPLPQPKPDELLIRVEAIGINRPDVQQRKGAYPPPPGASPILGLEAAGEVVAMGEAATGFYPGHKVTALTNGGAYAEYVAVPATQCLPWPNGYGAVEAAALPENYFTVWANMFDIGHLTSGEAVLIHGGTSGIGTTAIQLAIAFGAKVFATAGTYPKCATIERLGATAINYRESDFAEIIAEQTGKKGVNMVLDIVGAPYAERNIRCLGKDGRLILVAVSQGAKTEHFDLLPIMTRRLTITGSTMRPRNSAEKGAIAASLKKKVWPLLESGKIAPLIDRVFSLEEAPQAHELMESSNHIGKIILRV